MDIGWDFPSNGNGQIRGIADAGIETFNGKELKSLARETVQNSLDAAVSEDKTVIVLFNEHSVSKRNIPGSEFYENAIKKSKDYWDTTESEKAKAFLTEAYNQIKKFNSHVLVISDYNTVGLSDPYGNTLNGWNSLTKADGGATKSGESSGSFGIGKNAPYCNSYYRLVFYRTINQKRERAAQGISRLISFPEDINYPLDTMTTGFGYYGNKNRNKAIPQIAQLNDIQQREDIGTDVFIYGFKFHNVDWQKEIIAEVLENFIMSIYYGKLEVRVQRGLAINKNNLSTIIYDHKSKAKNAYCDYLVLTKKESDGLTIKERDFHGLGTLRLRVLINEKLKLNRKVLVVRKSGMTLFQMAGFPKSLQFSAILELEGKELNMFFRELETPSHDKWEPSRYEKNPYLAKQYVDELRAWVKEVILDLSEHSSGDEVNVEGLSDILQEDIQINDNSDDKSENLNNHLGQLSITQSEKPTPSLGRLYSASVGGRTKKTPGTLDGDSDISAVRTLKGVRKRTKKEKHKGRPDPKGKDIVNLPNESSKNAPVNTLQYLKIFKTKNKGVYNLTFIVPRNIKEGHLEITTIGENGKSSALNIKNASAVSFCENVEVKDNKIYFKNISGAEKVKMTFTLYETRNFAMGVNIYEHF